MNLDRLKVEAIDPCKRRHQIPLRLSRADRPRFPLEIFERLDVRILAPENRHGYITKLGYRHDGCPSGSANDGG